MTKSNLEPPQPQMPVRPRPDGSLELAGGNHSYYFAFTADHYMDTLEAENESLKACISHLSGGSSAQGLLAYRKFMLSRERKEEQ